MAIRVVLGEDSYIVREGLRQMLASAKSRAKRSALSEPTRRELEVLAAIAEGKRSAAISDALVLTKRAVEKHINVIFLKLNLSHAQDASDVSPLVKAALLNLAEPDLGAGARIT